MIQASKSITNEQLVESLATNFLENPHFIPNYSEGATIKNYLSGLNLYIAGLELKYLDGADRWTFIRLDTNQLVHVELIG